MVKYAALNYAGNSKAKNNRILIDGNYISEGEVRGEARENFMALVCEGIGTEKFASKAAEITSLSFLPLCGRAVSLLDLSDSIIKANSLVRKLQEKGRGYRKIASALTGIAIRDIEYTVFHLGDSRVYLYSEGTLKLLTEDHVVEIIADEEKEAEIEKINRRCKIKKLTHYIGGTGDQNKGVLKRGRMAKAVFLLCTGEVHRALDDEMVAKILSKEALPEEKSRTIFNLAVKNGSRGVISIVVIEALA